MDETAISLRKPHYLFSKVGTGLVEIPILREWRRYSFDRLNHRIEKVLEPYAI
jgi:hypothetical protein